MKWMLAFFVCSYGFSQGFYPYPPGYQPQGFVGGGYNYSQYSQYQYGPGYSVLPHFPNHHQNPQYHQPGHPHHGHHGHSHHGHPHGVGFATPFQQFPNPSFPFLGYTVSGSHTQIATQVHCPFCYSQHNIQSTFIYRTSYTIGHQVVRRPHFYCGGCRHRYYHNVQMIRGVAAHSFWTYHQDYYMSYGLPIGIQPNVRFYRPNYWSHYGQGFSGWSLGFPPGFSGYYP